MAKVKTTLPHHTLVYFATQAYRTFYMRGKAGPFSNNTVQGATLTTQYQPNTNTVLCSYTYNGVAQTKTLKAAKSWL